MGNEKNLKPFTSEQSREEAKKNGQKGGVASGVARREKKALKSTLEMLLTMPIEDGKLVDIDKIKSIASLDGKNISIQEAIVLAMLQKASRGDVKAFKAIADVMSQDTADDNNEESGVIIIPEVKDE